MHDQCANSLSSIPLFINEVSGLFVVVVVVFPRIKYCWCRFISVNTNVLKKRNYYLTTHSTFYLWLYGIRRVVKDHSDSEKANLPLHGLLFFIISTRDLLYAPFHRQDSTYHRLW